MVVAEERPGTLGGGLDVVAVRGEAAPTPQARRTAPYRPRYSLDQRAAGQYRWLGLGRLWVGCGATLTDIRCEAWAWGRLWVGFCGRKLVFFRNRFLI